ncbi:MAG: hypothetical protein KBG73_13435, partial [Candidatus Promineofilum sp.]|nr:hypothetical protein [Promineifilum sp.]
MGRSSRRALLALLLVALIGLGSAACRGATGSETPVADRAAPVATPPGLLPTPTLAAPGSEPAAATDPLHPPTPVVLPSATPLGAPADAPDEAALAGGAEATASPSAGEAVAEGQTAQVLPTVALPPDATAPELLALGQQAAAEGDHTTAAAAFRAAG